MISKLQYISQGITALEQEKNIKQALDNGADWIQFRWKNVSEKEQLKLAEKIKIICSNYKSTLIINDSVKIAKLINADGVHLGLEDESITDAKNSLGKNKIVGGTANTLNDVLQRIEENCSYIGLGPYQFTTTKKKLSPIVGLEGYQDILNNLKNKEINPPPIFAIGGIKINDIKKILETGIYGVALSGLITEEPTSISSIKKIVEDERIKNSK